MSMARSKRSPFSKAWLVALTLANVGLLFVLSRKLEPDLAFLLTTLLMIGLVSQSSFALEAFWDSPHRGWCLGCVASVFGLAVSLIGEGIISSLPFGGTPLVVRVVIGFAFLPALVAYLATSLMLLTKVRRQ